MKAFVVHFVGWVITYGFFGWFMDVTRYSEQSTLTHLMILFGLSAFMALLTTGKLN